LNSNTPHLAWLNSHWFYKNKIITASKQPTFSKIHETFGNLQWRQNHSEYEMKLLRQYWQNRDKTFHHLNLSVECISNLLIVKSNSTRPKKLSDTVLSNFYMAAQCSHMPWKISCLYHHFVWFRELSWYWWNCENFLQKLT
jgi:hypothetical protein